MALDARRSRLTLRPPHYVPDSPLDLHSELHSLTGRKAHTADLVLVKTPQDFAMGYLCKRQPLHASQPALRFGCLRYVLCASPLINRGAFGLMLHVRCAAESVPPAAIGSLPTAFPKRIRLAPDVRVHWGMRCAPTPIRHLTPAQCSTSRWSTPMVSRHTLIRFSTFAQPKRLAGQVLHRKQTSLRSVACGSRRCHDMVLRYAQNTVCARQEERTFAPHCRQSAARFTLAPRLQSCPSPLHACSGRAV